MNLTEYAQLIRSSVPTDWWTDACWGAHSAPSFRSSLAVWTDASDNFTGIEVTQYSNVAALKKDLSVTLAWGYPCNNDFFESWCERFSRKDASSDYIDFYYNGAVIYRDIYVNVDGGRVMLPMPSAEYDEGNKLRRLTIVRAKMDFYRLLNSLQAGYDYDSYIRQLDAEIVDSPWME
jgi:hypothetical protein